MMNTFDKVYKLVEKVPRGKVTTYGTIAKQLGINNPRVVGYALHANKTPDTVPCHRVINAQGELSKDYAFGGLDVQKKLLIQEGIKFQEDKIPFEKYLFKFED